jgi:iron(III) transport system substrate-binding protein
MKGLLANKPTLETSDSLALSLVGQGQAAITVTGYGDYAGLKAKGAPVAWVWMNPVVAAPFYGALIKNAPDPATAKLFEQYLLSPAGQIVFEQTGALSLVPAFLSLYSQFPANASSVAASNAGDLNPTYWKAVYNNLGFP